MKLSTTRKHLLMFSCCKTHYADEFLMLYVETPGRKTVVVQLFRKRLLNPMSKIAFESIQQCSKIDVATFCKQQQQQQHMFVNNCFFPSLWFGVTRWGYFGFVWIHIFILLFTTWHIISCSLFLLIAQRALRRATII